MSDINRLDFTDAGVISMKMYSCIAQCDSSIHVSTWLKKMLMDFACTVSFAKLFQSWTTLAAKKFERTPLAS